MQKYLEEKGEMCSRIIYEPPYQEQLIYIDVKGAGEKVVLNMFVEYISHSQEEAAEHNNDTFGMNDVASDSYWNSAIQLFTWCQLINEDARGYIAFGTSTKSSNGNS